MITFKYFREVSDFARENLILEARGFRSIASTRKKARKDYESKRTAKIKLLKRRTGGSDELWKGLV
jgi:hypothetical protein